MRAIARIPKGRACAPVLFERRRVRRLPPPSRGQAFSPPRPGGRGESTPDKMPRGWSAKRRTSLPSCRAPLSGARAPLGAPSRLFCPRDRNFRVRTGEVCPSLIRAAFAALRPRRVQPSKAVPLSRDGRLPEASRCRGYEPQQQAPRQPMSGLPDIGPLKLLHLRNVSRRRPQLSNARGEW